MATALTHRVPRALAPALPITSPFRFQKEARADILALFERWAELGGVTRFQSRVFVSHLVTSPEGVQHVLQDNHKNYTKEVRSAAVFRVALGDGLFLSEGDKWRAQRRTAQPAFHRQRLAAMTTAMGDAVAAMLARWQSFAASGESFDLMRETSRLTIDVIGRTLVGQDLSPYADSLARAMVATFDYFNHALNHIIVAPLFVPTARNRALKRALEETQRLVNRVIEARRAHPSEVRDDLLSMLLEAYDAPGDAAQLRDDLGTFLGAGTETTAVALSWAWYLLSKHPAAERRLREEVDGVLGSRQPTIDDVPRLSYARMVVDETMRLYPPAWAISRTAVGDDEICGFHIPAGSAVFTSPWVTHRNRRYWNEPDKFDPERFTPERSRGRHEYAYYPFGGGPRICIGDRFSVMEQTLALAMTAQKFRVRVDHDGVPDPVFTVRPKGGIRATIAPG
ncbi:MAG: cytochrome P450 [Candidatus Binataceae bacterium]